jgi:hypothetical protein
MRSNVKPRDRDPAIHKLSKQGFALTAAGQPTLPRREAR